MPQSQSSFYKELEKQAQYGFINRQFCPACGSVSTAAVFRSSFDEGAIGRFVDSYYRSSRGTLSAAPYELARSCECTLLYQRFAGDDRLLGKLYCEWINDPDQPEHDEEYIREIAALGLP